MTNLRSVLQLLALLCVPVVLQSQASIVPTSGSGSGSSGVFSMIPTNYSVNQSAGTVSSQATTAFTSSAGSLLVVAGCSFGNTIGAAPFSDSKSNTWSIAIASTGTTKGWCAMGYTENLANAGSSHTVTFTATAPDFLVVAVLEIPGMATSSALNQTNAASVNGTTHTAGPITAGPTYPEIHIGAGALSASAEGVPQITTALFFRAARLTASATVEGMAFGYRIAQKNSSTTFEYTTSNSQFETAMVAGFKGATP